jgi:hypothetical protein
LTVKWLAALLAITVWAHAGHEHGGPKDPEVQNPEREKRLFQINDAYVARVKPIFQAKCFNCHSEDTKFPWYYAIPGVKQFIDSDIAEAKEHIEMTHDFPFRGHGSPEKDLEAVGSSIAEGDMPPWYYRLFHTGSKVTEEESEIILKWVKASRELLFWDKKEAVPADTH